MGAWGNVPPPPPTQPRSVHPPPPPGAPFRILKNRSPFEVVLIGDASFRNSRLARRDWASLRIWIKTSFWSRCLFDTEISSPVIRVAISRISATTLEEGIFLHGLRKRTSPIKTTLRLQDTKCSCIDMSPKKKWFTPGTPALKIGPELRHWLETHSKVAIRQWNITAYTVLYYSISTKYVFKSLAKSGAIIWTTHDF